MEVEAGGVTVNSQAKRKPPASLQRGQELNKFSKEKQDERYLGDQTVRRSSAWLQLVDVAAIDTDLNS